MFQALEQVVSYLENEAQLTQKILDALTDDSLDQAVTEDDRTLGRMAWHLVTTVHEMLERTGLTFDAPHEDMPLPETAKEIADGYRKASSAALNAIKAQWTDASLNELHDMYGEEWPNHQVISVLINHQIHHRGQMTVLMRQAGLRVPGIYGPSREEWSSMGMEAPSV